MTAEQRWREAFDAEAAEPSDWHADIAALRQRLAARGRDDHLMLWLAVDLAVVVTGPPYPLDTWTAS